MATKSTKSAKPKPVKVDSDEDEAPIQEVVKKTTKKPIKKNYEDEPIKIKETDDAVEALPTADVEDFNCMEGEDNFKPLSAIKKGVYLVERTLDMKTKWGAKTKLFMYGIKDGKFDSTILLSTMVSTEFLTSKMTYANITGNPFYWCYQGMETSKNDMSFHKFSVKRISE